MEAPSIVRVSDLRTYFHTSEGIIPAVDGSNFEIKKGEVVTIVGESGSGKSVTALSMLKLVPIPPAKIHSGQVLFGDQNLLELDLDTLRKVRGKEISMVFQNPAGSLDSCYTIGQQMREAVIAHEKVSIAEAEQRACRMLEAVGILEPEKCMKLYPHALSSGICQRVMVAIALLCEPKLLIADEPTTNLDAFSQGQILKLIKTMQRTLGISVLLITHDFAAVTTMSDRVIVMYAGKIVETADLRTILENPSHPYTRALISSVPKVGSRGRLWQINGEPVDMLHLPEGCRFSPRCDFATDRCYKEEPPERFLTPNHMARCFLVNEDL